MGARKRQPEFPEIPLELQRRFAEGKVVLFVGAGVSVAAGLPDWEGLAKRVTQARRNLKAQSLRKLSLEQQFCLFLDDDDFDARQKVREVFHQELAQNCDTTSHQILVRLPVSLILTTNYDPNLERAARLLHRDCGVVIMDRDVPQNFKTKELTIVHLYGDTEDFLASEDEMITFDLHRPALSNILQHTFLIDTVFFLGFSLRDSNVLRQVLLTRKMVQDEEIINPIRHYACMVTEDSQISKVWHGRGIDAFIVKPGKTSRETSQIFIQFLRYLARTVAELAYDRLDREAMVRRVETNYYSECMERAEAPLIRQESTFSVLALPESFAESGLDTPEGYELGVQRKRIYEQCMKDGMLKLILNCQHWIIRGYSPPVALKRLQAIRRVVEEHLDNPRFVLGIRHYPTTHQSSASLGSSILLRSELLHVDGLANKKSYIVRERHAIAVFNEYFDHELEILMHDTGAQFSAILGPDDIRKLKELSLETLDRLIGQLEGGA